MEEKVILAGPRLAPPIRQVREVHAPKALVTREMLLVKELSGMDVNEEEARRIVNNHDQMLVLRRTYFPGKKFGTLLPPASAKAQIIIWEEAERKKEEEKVKAAAKAKAEERQHCARAHGLDPHTSWRYNQMRFGGKVVGKDGKELRFGGHDSQEVADKRRRNHWHDHSETPFFAGQAGAKCEPTPASRFIGTQSLADALKAVGIVTIQEPEEVEATA